MPYYECPVCGGGYVIDPAPAHPVCDRDGAALKRASEESYAPRDHDDESEAPKAKPKPKPHKKKAKS
jgi:hypothetical protein